MKLHERELLAERAANELHGAFLELQEKYELTFAEMFYILSERLASLSKSCIRAERYPPKGGDP